MVDFFLPLFVVLAFMLCATVIYCRFDFMEPSVIVVGMMTLSTFMSIIMAERWGLVISSTGFIFIVAVLLTFFAGGYFARNCFASNKKGISENTSFHTYNVGWLTIFFVTALMLIMLYSNVQRVYAISLLHGNIQGFEGYLQMIRIVRPLVESGEMPSFGFKFGVIFNFSRLITYIFIYLFAYNLLYSKSHRCDLRLLIPAVLEIPFQILTTGRLGLFIVVVYTFIVALILYQKGRNYSFSSKLNALKIMAVGSLLFVGAFLLMGMLTWKGVTSDRTPIVILSHYVGLSIPAFDGLTHLNIPESEYIGSHTLQGVYRLLHAIFAGIPALDAFLPFVRFNGIDTNVFTMFGQYLMDYGYIGTLALAWIFGFIYNLCYSSIKYRTENIEVPIIMYGYLAYPLFLCSISERIFMDFTNTAGAFAVVLFMMIKIIFSKRLFGRQ